MQQTGTFIAIEGTDGSGKATQTGLLADALQSLGYTVKVFSFPRYQQPSSYFVRNYLQGAYGPATSVNPYAASMMYALDRFETAGEIAAALSRGEIVIADRFTASNMAHQATKLDSPAARQTLYHWIDTVESDTLQIPKPTRTIILNIKPETAATFRAGRGNAPDGHEADTTHTTKAAQLYLELCELFPLNFTRIDCDRSGRPLSVDAVHKLILGVVTPLLPAPSVAQDADKLVEAVNARVTDSAIDPPQPKNTPAATANETTPINTSSLRGPESIEPSTNQAQPVTSTIYAKSVASNFSIPTKTTGYYVPPQLSTFQAKQYATQLKGLHELRLQITDKVHAYATGPGQHDPNIVSESLWAVQSLLPFATTVETSANYSEPATANTANASDIGATEPFDPTLKFKLVRAKPHNELAILPDMLNPTSGSAPEVLRQQIETWPIGKKLQALLTTLEGDKQTTKGYQYEWHIYANYNTLSQLESVGARISLISTKSADYVVPQLVEAAGLSDTYIDYFMRAAELYSLLDATNIHPNIAGYARLLGHRLLYSVQLNALQLFELDQTVTLWRDLQESIEALHPSVFNVLNNPNRA